MAVKEKNKPIFSISEAIRFGWQVTKKHFWFFVAMIFISEVIDRIVPYIYEPMFGYTDILVILLGIIVFISGWVLSIELSFAAIVIYFKFADKKKALLKDLFGYFDSKILFNYFLVGLLYGLGVVIGFVLFVIPGIYFAIKYSFVLYIYVDKRIGVIDSFKESARLTQGVKWKILRLGLLQFLILLGGAFALLVGLFIAVPIKYISDIYLYRKLLDKRK